MYKYLVLFFLLVCLNNANSNQTYTPVVIWHGMGDSCCHPLSLGRLMEDMKERLPGIYILSLEFGNGFIEDTLNSFLLHPNKQIEIACDVIKSDPMLKDGFNGLAFSQGSQFLRGLLQRCPDVKMKTLATVGGQHAGVYGLPWCPVDTNQFCDEVRPFVNSLIYLSIIQENLVQSTYWHDPINETEHNYKSTFIADINNEFYINQTYVERLQSLEKFVMVKFEQDHMVQPRETQWFGFYKLGQAEIEQGFREFQVYDRLGLRKMDEEGKLHFLSLPGIHMQFKNEWLIENVIIKYFS